MDAMIESFKEIFELHDHEVTRNQPFAGGYITRTYGGNPIPWIQIEMNRDLYIKPGYFDRSTLTIDPGRLLELNAKFKKVLHLFFERIGKKG